MAGAGGEGSDRRVIIKGGGERVAGGSGEVYYLWVGRGQLGTTSTTSWKGMGRGGRERAQGSGERVCGSGGGGFGVRGSVASVSTGDEHGQAGSGGQGEHEGGGDVPDQRDADRGLHAQEPESERDRLQ